MHPSFFYECVYVFLRLLNDVLYKTYGFAFEDEARNDPLDSFEVPFEDPARGVCSNCLNESYHDNTEYQFTEP